MYTPLYIFGTNGASNGIIAIVSRSDSSDPVIVSLTASYPFPCSNSLCPGRALSACSVSGAPRNIEGIVSRNVCVTPIAIMKQHSTIGEVNPNRYPDMLNNNRLARLMCIPGVRPVNVPASVPRIIAAIISRNI